MAENGNVNLVLGKALSILPEAELFEPVRNPLHRNSADFLLASTSAGRSVHILLAKIVAGLGPARMWFGGSPADIATCPCDVRLTSKSGTHDDKEIYYDRISRY
jgi:hypothetical protein